MTKNLVFVKYSQSLFSSGSRVCLKTPKRRLFCPKTVLSASNILERRQAFLAVFSLKALVLGQKSDISPVLKQTLGDLREREKFFLKKDLLFPSCPVFPWFRL
jgi:hypothetical protein